ncbi:MAG: MFS transporter [Desulfobacteraceae bacterium]|nr:MFS transporter [Desulfobacteraceae bacterium]
MNNGVQTLNSNVQTFTAEISSHPPNKWFVLATVLVGATMSALDISIVNVAMPTLKTTFAASMAAIEWIVLSYMLTLAIFLPLFGRLSDVFGRSRFYILGFIIFSAGSLCCGMSSTAAFLIASRIIQAIGAALLQANSVALITEAFPSRLLGKAIGIQGMVQAVSMAIGPFVGGVLIATVGWRAIFYVNIPIGILGTIAAFLILRPMRQPQRKEKIDYRGAALFASGLTLLVLAFNEGVKLGWGSSAILAYFIAGAVLLSLFVMTELTVKHPLIDLKLFKDPAFFVGNLTGMLSFYVLFTVLFLMPFYLEKVLGTSVALTGFLLTPLLLTMAAVAPLSGHISDKYGPRIMTTLGMLFSAAACFALASMGTSATMPLVMAAVIILMGTGMGLFTPANNSGVMDAAPTEKLGMAGSVLNMMRSLGLILGVDISGGIFSILEHQYLAASGYRHVRHVFSNTTIPLPIKDDAFMHGFTIVIMALLAVSVLSALLSAVWSNNRSGIVDHELAESDVISTGFFSGFNQETKRLALFTMLLLLGGMACGGATLLWHNGDFPFPPSRQKALQNDQAMEQAQRLAAAEKEAAAYYAQKYHDAGARIEVKPRGNHFEAHVIKNGVFIRRLSIRGNTITEHRTGLQQWIFDLLTNV